MRNAVQWLTIQQAADRACCGPKAIRRAVRDGRLQAARTRSGELKFLESWIDEWLVGQVVPQNAAIDLAIDAAPSGRRDVSY